jgi:hypothetical protein
MPRTHYWFATDVDTKSVIAWLRDNGAVPINGRFDEVDYTQAKELLLHFPDIGPVEFWPAGIDPTQYQRNSARRRSAIRAQVLQRNTPGASVIDWDKSATATFCCPFKRSGRFWTTSELHFTASKLKDTFPDLNRTCSRFHTWLRKNELVYDNTRPELFSPFEYNLGGMDHCVRRVYALPEALRLLQKSEIMTDWNMNESRYQVFLKTLRLRGIEVEPDPPADAT